MSTADVQAIMALKHTVDAMASREQGPPAAQESEVPQAMLGSILRQKGQRGEATHTLPSSWEPAIRENRGLSGWIEKRSSC